MSNGKAPMPSVGVENPVADIKSLVGMTVKALELLNVRVPTLLLTLEDAQKQVFQMVVQADALVAVIDSRVQVEKQMHIAFTRK